MSLFLLQDTSADPELLDEVVSEEKTLSIFNLIMEGGVGGQIIIALLFILLMVGLYIYFERFLAIKAASKIDKNYMNQIRDNISSGNLEAAKILSQNNRSPVARLIERGFPESANPWMISIRLLRMPENWRFTNWRKTLPFWQLLPVRHP